MYRVVVKVDNAKFVKYHTDNLLSLVQFLDKSYRGWRWFNVFCKRSGDQLASFTTKHRPATKRLSV